MVKSMEKVFGLQQIAIFTMVNGFKVKFKVMAHIFHLLVFFLLII